MGNLSDKLDSFNSAEELKTALEKYLVGNINDSVRYILSDNDNAFIRELIENKYSTEDWNLGYGPDYKFRNTFENNNVNILLELQVNGGVISECRIEGSTDWERTASKLIGKKHLYSDISEIIMLNHPAIPEDIIYSFF